MNRSCIYYTNFGCVLLEGCKCMKERQLLLFSGGPDSTILLEFLLKQKNIDLYVLFLRLAWNKEKEKKMQIQEKVAEKVINYFKNEGHQFNYLTSGISIGLQKQGFGYDDQWSAFLGSMICHQLNIKKMWSGFYTYTYLNSVKIRGHGPDWIFDGSLKKYIRWGCSEDHKFISEFQYLTPRKHFNGKEIDRFKSKKEAYLTLKPELREMTRSCYGTSYFCGTCYKCETLIKNKITDNKGNWIL